MRRTRGAVCVFLFLLVTLIGADVTTASPFREYSKEHLFLLQRRGALARSDYHVLRSLPASRQQLQLRDVNAMSVAQLKGMLRDRETSCVGCVERRQLVERALEVQHWPTLDERVADELVALENTPLDPAAYEESVRLLMEASQDMRCHSAANGTMVCVRDAE
ncbi:hypothetical protein DQ04_02141100 [Trypanosoma grayi]|uniref:hypothetical protein n=1 Tax=Trypanosoma grayi TaxID=71804 RepID=UPI0004F4A487|nr:hypothetical protein DQ04_02141100 [Trypanosoma grayi]KEG11932.1 hypothetical protein DQ04_02141100 [Trypanosoma grayi]